jgi:hypothetical protein
MTVYDRKENTTRQWRRRDIRIYMLNWNQTIYLAVIHISIIPFNGVNKSCYALNDTEQFSINGCTSSTANDLENRFAS